MSKSVLIPEYNSDDESPQINELKIINYDELVIDNSKFKNRHNSKLDFLEFIALTCNNVEKLKFIDLFINENFPSIFEDKRLTFQIETSIDDITKEVYLDDSFDITTDANMFLQTYNYIIESDTLLKNICTGIESKTFKFANDLKSKNFGLIEFLYGKNKTPINDVLSRSKSCYKSNNKTSINQTITATYKTIKTDELTKSIMKAIEPILNKVKISLLENANKPVYQVLFFMNAHKSKGEFITKA